MNYEPPASGTSPMPMKPGTKVGGVGGDADVAGAREREPGAGGRAR